VPIGHGGAVTLELWQAMAEEVDVAASFTITRRLR